jgi:SAM-dependent methyltransferase
MKVFGWPIFIRSPHHHQDSGVGISKTVAMNSQIDQNQRPHNWRAAGDAWGHAANEWACLYEHYAADVIIAIFERVGVCSGVSLLDLACGSGMAIYRARAIGADVSGIDASEELVAIARTRNPTDDVRLGSMFELPWGAGTFDAVVSINGIWGGCGDALIEANRVLRPGGRIGISFWGTARPLDLRECFKVYARHAPPEHFGSMKTLNNIGTPGVAEDMLLASGFEIVERGQRVSLIEWPDAEIAWRALSSVGPAVPALRNGDIDAIKRDVLAAIEPCLDERGIYRFRNDHQFVIAQKPA